MSLDHEYTNEALSKLIEATNAIANEVGDVQADIEKAKEYKMISSDPLKQHMRITLERQMISNQCIAKHPKAKYPGLADEGRIKSASESIKLDVLALEQKMKLKLLLSR
jgi:hypothetical protein